MNFSLKFFKVILLATFALIFHSCDTTDRVEVKKQKIGNIELAYYTRGSGEPLVMIMGFRGTMSIWDPALLELLEKKYQLILFDNRGAGLTSDVEKDPLTISQMAEDTAELIKALGHQKVHVLGWSMGARIALELALKHPDTVDCLILCSPNSGGDYQAFLKSNISREKTSQNLSLREGLALIFPNTLKGNKAAAFYIARVAEAIVSGSSPDDLIVSKSAIDRQKSALSLWNKNNHTFEALPSLKCPTLLTTGIEDALNTPKNVQIMANEIPFAWTAYFPGAGHNFLSQSYENFGNLVILFIETNKQNSR